MNRRFEFILSHDRELTIGVAASLMSRVWPEARTADLPQLPLPRARLLPSPRLNPLPAPQPVARRRRQPGHCPARAYRPDAPRAQRAVPRPAGRALDAATTGIMIVDMSRPDAR